MSLDTNKIGASWYVASVIVTIVSILFLICHYYGFYNYEPTIDKWWWFAKDWIKDILYIFFVFGVWSTFASIGLTIQYKFKRELLEGFALFGFVFLIFSLLYFYSYELGYNFKFDGNCNMFSSCWFINGFRFLMFLIFCVGFILVTISWFKMKSSIE
jgi:hypothetical protein